MILRYINLTWLRNYKNQTIQFLMKTSKESTNYLPRKITSNYPIQLSSRQIINRNYNIFRNQDSNNKTFAQEVRTTYQSALIGEMLMVKTLKDPSNSKAIVGLVMW